jgi:hypothetical protein
MRKVLLIIYIITSSFGLSVCNEKDHPTEPQTQIIETMKLKITVGDSVLTATMYDNAATRDFISLLPLTLTLEDYAETEKISNLPKRLSTAGTPAGSDPSVGDITYYAPWGNLALFYKDFGYSSGLVILGKIDSGVAAFNVSGSVKVKMELME